MVEQGSVFGIPLEKNLGFAYIQCIYTGEVGFIPNLMLKVYDLHSNFLEKSLDVIEASDELCYPFLMMGEPTLRGKNKWNKIGVLNVSNIIIPDLRQYLGGTALVKNSDWSNITWEVIHNFNYQRPVESLSYNSIKHLGIWRHSSNVAIQEFLTMFIIKKLGKKAADYYTDEEIFGKGNFWKRGAFYEAENLVFYSEIPYEYRGRVIPY